MWFDYNKNMDNMALNLFKNNILFSPFTEDLYSHLQYISLCFNGIGFT